VQEEVLARSLLCEAEVVEVGEAAHEPLVFLGAVHVRVQEPLQLRQLARS